ncbi:hypothetical protein F5Y18DRAFT_253278 [Xylariaceae sp. FL1019]|nr:hypothetical protein F5Y18DRAFT_253278 [Xylariaceae sp. FL1019]
MTDCHFHCRVSQAQISLTMDSSPGDSTSPTGQSAAEQELRRRRERGRLSQARFRKRQAQVSNEMRDENQRLKDAIAQIVNKTRQSDRPALIEAVRAAAGIAGVDAATSGKELEDTDGVANLVTMNNGRVAQESNEILPLHSMRRNAKGARAHGSAVRLTADASPAEISLPLGPLSPRLDYGIWLDSTRAVNICKPPQQIEAYIGEGQHTFAGQLYWACADYMLELCRIVTMPYAPSPWFRDAPSTRPDAREAEERVFQRLRHSPRLANVRLAQALVEAHTEFRDHGYVLGDSILAADPSQRLAEAVEQDFAARSEEMESWLDVPKIESYLRRQLGAEAFSRLNKFMVRQATACPLEHTQELDLEAHKIIKLLIKNLAERYTCFGNGPRWPAECVAVMLRFDQRQQSTV